MSKAEEISSIIKERIDNYDIKQDLDEVGRVLSVADGIASVYGLDSVGSSEIVEFENGEQGLALNLESNHVGVVVLG